MLEFHAAVALILFGPVVIVKALSPVDDLGDGAGVFPRRTLGTSSKLFAEYPLKDEPRPYGRAPTPFALRCA